MTPRHGTAPDRETVVEWMEQTGQSGIEAARHFWDLLTKDEERQQARKYNRWAQNKRTKEAEAAEAAELKRPAPVYEDADMLPVERYRKQLAHLAADLKQARQLGELKLVAGLDRRYQEVAAALDAEKRRAAKMGIGIERTPAGLEAAIREREQLLRALQEREARNEVRRRNTFAAAAERGRNL